MRFSVNRPSFSASVGFAPNNMLTYQRYLLHQEILFYTWNMATVSTHLDFSMGTDRLFKVLADPTRLALLRRLSESDATVTELVSDLGEPPQSRVSNHLACLRW